MDFRGSIIIPVYNSEQTIRKCVESLVYGLEYNVEIILVDDCSSDSSWKMCQMLQQEFEQVKCMQNEKNSGVSFTRNQGIKAAQGEYILFVDSDDWVSGKYVFELLNAAERYNNTLIICGYKFINRVSRKDGIYVYNSQKLDDSVIPKERFFELIDKVLLQPSWNKVFRRDIIESAHIQFDEMQNMGEDFQFVLDYMEAIKCERCVVINKLLYYYIRANRTSLMSKFGLIQNDNEFNRYKKLLKISGANNEIVQTEFKNAVRNIKQNYVYQIMRDNSKSKEEKLKFIESIMLDGNALRYYNQQRMIIYKEKISNMPDNVRKFVLRVKDRLRRERNTLIIKYVRSNIKSQNFSVISQNCIGGVLYHDINMKFKSPTIDLFFESNDFVRFVLDLKNYMDKELKIYWDEEYPVGYLGDVKIYFMHYSTCKEAKEAWEKRSERIDYEKIIVLATDMESFTDDVYESWKNINYHKVLFTANRRFGNDESSVYYPEYEKEGKVLDLIPERRFYKNNILIRTLNKLS